MTNEPRPRPLSRRALLGGVGAAGVALPTFLAASGAPATSRDAAPRARRVRGFAAAAATPGLSYQTFTGNSFRVASGTASVGPVGIIVGTGPADFYLPIEHPNSVLIRELEVYVQDVAPGGVAGLRVVEPLTGSQTMFAPDFALPTGSGAQTASKLDYAVDVDGTRNQSVVHVHLDGAGQLLGVRLGFEEFVGLTFFPVDPSKRQVDTRNTRNRLVVFETYRLPLEVPPFAFALVNLTLTQTVAAGFLSAFPADISWPGTASVNWFQANQDTGNLVVVGTDSQGAINLYCGAGQTHVVVDLEGFYY